MEIEPGRCYWYTPNPVDGEDSCSSCGFLFASDHASTFPDPHLVLVLHYARLDTTHCPECAAVNRVPIDSYFRVRNLSLFGEANVAGKWLHRATPEQIEQFFINEENEADDEMGVLPGDVIDVIANDEATADWKENMLQVLDQVRPSKCLECNQIPHDPECSLGQHQADFLAKIREREAEGGSK